MDNYEKKYKEALERARANYKADKEMGFLENCDMLELIFPELKESYDERIRKKIIEHLEMIKEGSVICAIDTSEEIAWLENQKDASKAIEAVERIDKYIDEHLANAHDMKDSNPDKKYYRGWDDALGEMARILQDVYSGEKQKEQESIKMEGTTICGQDYKCKKDYKAGNCWYIKDAIYHCGRDGYLTDQNSVSWSCTPEWFKEYIQSNTEWAEEEKTRFVSGQFLQCKLSFGGFKEGEHYWLEYIGDDMYVGRSDNILNQKFHITPRQLFTLFSQRLDEVQGPPEEEKQVSLNYEPPFDENPSDKEIIEALIKHLKEQDGFLTAINCVSTKAILTWLEKQKEEEGMITVSKEAWDENAKDSFERGIKVGMIRQQKEQKHPDGCFTCDEYKKGYEAGRLNGLTAGYNKAKKEQKPSWSEEDEKLIEEVCRCLCEYAWYNTKGIPVSPDALKDTARHFYELGKQSKEPVNEDLEAEIKRYRKEEMPVVLESDLNDIARHFANWQKEQMIRDCSVQASYEAEIEKAEERGYNLCKEQMLKNAVEGEVCKDYIVTEKPFYFYQSRLIELPDNLKEGDKVKIVIVKEN